MEADDLRHQPALGFLKQMSTGTRALFVLALLLIAAVAAWGVFAAIDPARDSVVTRQVTDNQPGEVVISDATHSYRTMDLRLNAFSQDVLYTAEMMMPKTRLALIFILVQAVAWSLFLSAATFVRSIWAYVAMVPFAIVWYLSLFGDLIAPGQGWIVSGGWILILLILSFLLQNNVLRLSMLLRFLIFLALMVAPIALIYFQKGEKAFHISGVNMFLAIALLSIVWLVIIAREPTHLLLLFANNAKDESRRLPSVFLIGLWTVLAGLEFCMFADMMELKWVPIQHFPFRPIHLIAISSIASMVTLQNQHVRLGNMIPKSAFTIGIGGCSLMMMATLAYYTASGEHLYLYMMERLAAMIFFVFGVLHLFFLFFNFGPLLKAKKPIYFITATPKRLMYFFVVLLGALICLAMEGAQGRKTLRFLWCTVYDLEADRELGIGNDRAAMQFYEMASAEARTVKGNYNLAQLALMLDKDASKAKEHFELATVFVPYSWASINNANLDLMDLQYISARVTLQEAWREDPSPAVANNLAGIWMRLEEPDSAIKALKDGLAEFPDASILYSALGQIYLRYNRDSWAQESFAQALALKHPDPTAVTNAFYYNLSHGDSLEVPAPLLQLPEVRANEGAMINYALHLYKTKALDSCQQVIDTLLAHDMAPEAALLDGMLKFERGQMDLALSRMEYIASTSGELASQANSFLGVMYFMKGVPEMSAEFFGIAAAADTTQTLNYLRQAQMVIDAGDHERAFQLLQQLRVRDERLFNEANKEIAMLFQAQGQSLQAMLEYDLSLLTPDERLRISCYAGKVRNYEVMLENFRQIMDADSTSILPQLEFARIYRRNRDTSAIGDVISNLEYALTRKPKDPELQAELVYAYTAAGEVTKARTLSGSLDLKQVEPSFGALLQASLRLAERDTVEAVGILEKYVKQDQMSLEVNRLLASLYLAQHEYGKGFQFIYPLVNQLNYKNPEYWLYTAHFQRNMSDPEAAGRAAIRAISLSTLPADRDAISKVFANEIRLAIELNPELKK